MSSLRIFSREGIFESAKIATFLSQFLSLPPVLLSGSLFHSSLKLLWCVKAFGEIETLSSSLVLFLPVHLRK